MGRKSKQTILAEKQAFDNKVRDYLSTTYGIDIDTPMDRTLALKITSVLVFDSKDRSVEYVAKRIYDLCKKFTMNTKVVSTNKLAFDIYRAQLSKDGDSHRLELSNVISWEFMAIKTTKEELKGLADFLNSYLQNIKE